MTQFPNCREQPFNIEMEQALLACCIIDGGIHSISTAIDEGCKAEWFHRLSNRELFEILLKLYNKGVEIDELIIHEQINKSKSDVIESSYLIEVMNRVDSASHLPYYIKAVKELYTVREIIRTSNTMIQQCYEGGLEAKELVSKAQSAFMLLSASDTRGLMNSATVAKRAIDRINERGQGVAFGLMSGLDGLDKICRGFRPGHMIVIGARPGTGKTALAGEIAINVGIRNRERVLFFSQEMDAEELGERFISSMARVNLYRVEDRRVNQVDIENMKRAGIAFQQSNIIWSDMPGMTVELKMRS